MFFVLFFVKLQLYTENKCRIWSSSFIIYLHTCWPLNHQVSTIWGNTTTDVRWHYWGKYPLNTHTLEILWDSISNGSRFVSLNSQFCQDRLTRTPKPDFVVQAVMVVAVLAYKPSCRREAIHGGEGIKICVSHHAYIQCLVKCILSLVLYHDELPFLCSQSCTVIISPVFRQKQLSP